MRAHQIAPTITAAFRPVVAVRLARVTAALRASWRARAEKKRLRDFSDWELFDIGLKRQEIDLAYDETILDDAELRLQRMTRARDRAEGIIRRAP